MPLIFRRSYPQTLSMQFGWFLLLVIASACMIATRFLVGSPSLVWYQYLYFMCAVLGQCLLIVGGINVLFVLPVWKTGSFAIVKRLWASVVNSALLVFLLADTFVFQQYRFHLNWVMLDLALNTEGQVIHFSPKMQLQIAFLVGALFLLVFLWTYVSKIFLRYLKSRYLFGLMFVALVGANLTNMFAVAQAYRPVTSLNELVPFYRPIRANTFLERFDLVKPSEVVSVDHDVGTFVYPRHALQFKNDLPKTNIVIIAIDALRADMLTQSVMPNTWTFKEKAFDFQQHYSSGNATRAGIFGLFYGLPPTYWQSALATHEPAALIRALQEKQYQMGVFTTASLTKPEFSQTIFAGVPNLRLASPGQSVAARDEVTLRDFSSWMDARDKEKPFFSFLFFDSVHAYDFPTREPLPFKPSWCAVNNLELGPDFDPTPYFNRYKNAVHWVDTLIGDVLKKLEKENLLDNTIVIVTSDHGEEFNDNKLNYWGHNGNFSQTQIKIPLLLYWPHEKPHEISYVTTAYDISVTLLTKVLGCTNPTSDYGVGQDLFLDVSRFPFFVGSYLQDAIVTQEGILLINKAGFLDAYDPTWHPIAIEPLKKYLPDYLAMRSEFRR